MSLWKGRAGLPRYGRRAHRARAAVAVLAAASAVWLAPTGGAFAATGPAGGSPASHAAPAKTGSRASAPAHQDAKSPKAAKSAKTVSSAPRTAAGLKAQARTEHAAAVRETAAADLPEACSGALAPDTIYSCPAMPQAGSTYTFTLPQATDLVFVQLVGANSFGEYPAVTAPDGSTVACDHPDDSQGFGDLRCATDQAGVYTLGVPHAAGADYDFTVAYRALLSDTACTAVTAQDTALGAPVALSGSLAAGSPGDCYDLPMASGDMLREHLSDWRATTAVYDATGTQVCRSADTADPEDCALTGTAPFRLLVSQGEGAQLDYALTASRLSTPDGCPVLAPQAYGTAPDVTSAVRCRVLHVTAAGTYGYGTATGGDYDVTGGLYRSDGTPVCTDPTANCTLTAGDYTWARAGNDSGPADFGVWFRGTAATGGCSAGRDDDFASGPLAGSFDGVAEQLCWTLPTASGHGLYLLDQMVYSGVADAAVYDAAGVRQCDDAYSFGVCKLTGTAPFHVVLAGPSRGAGPDYGTYRYTVQRTDGTAGCTAWPQSAFGGSWGASPELTADQQMACLSIPANQHAASELFDYTNTRNRLDATVQVYDGAGNKVCANTGSSAQICRLQSGVGYMAVLVGTGYSETYDLVRRDVSSTASCLTPASLTVGGASTSFSFTSALDSRCLRVTAAATDKMWLSVRTPTADYETGADLGVVDASGQQVCWQQGVSCHITGSTSYVVFVLASGYDGNAIDAHVDTWRIGTASGWVPQCTATTLSPDGFPVRSGTLTESASGSCAVMNLRPSMNFDLYGTESDPNGASAWVSLFAPTSFTGSGIDTAFQCNGQSFGFDFSCFTSSSLTPGQYVVVISARNAPTPAEYSFQGVCTFGCSTPHQAADLTSVSPASGPTGTMNQVVVHGSNLNLGTEVSLAHNADTVASGQPVSVSADGTSLTVLLWTGQADPGTYDVVLGQPGYTVGTKSTGYLPDAYTVTAAPTAAQSRLVPVTPTRFLDTRNGTGAPKARVGAGGTVKLAVAGMHGVPSSGVTAVTMNVTVVNPTTGGHVTVYPDGQPLPAVSSVSYQAGHTIANLVTVPVHDGVVDLANSAGDVDLLADVTGYYTDGGAGSALTPVTPTRFLDTRNGTGAPKARVGAGGTVKLKVAGVHGVPSSGVTAVTMNVTVVNPTTGGHVTVYPDGQSAPDVSNINYGAGQTIPNLVTVPVTDGTVDLLNSAGSVDLLADVTGYFSATGSAYTATDPVRLLDTRSGLGARVGQVGPGGTVSFRVSDVDGVPADGVTAVALNVTVTAPTATSHLTVYPHGTALPGVSNLNYPAGTTIANQVVVPVVDGRVSLTNYAGDVQVLADLDGYYTGS